MLGPPKIIYIILVDVVRFSKGSDGLTDRKNRLVDTVGEGESGLNSKSSMEIYT